MSYEPGDRRHQLAVREGFRPDGIYHDVVGLLALLDGESREIVDIDRLQAIPAVAKYTEYREVPQDPRDVVDQDVLFPEQHRGPQDRIPHAGVLECSFEVRFAAKILQL